MKYLLLILVWILSASIALANEPAPAELLVTGKDSDFYMSDAAFYPAKGKRAIIFVPGYIFNKESWKKLAVNFQKRGIASIAISAKSNNPIRRAIQELVRRGYKDIILIGGSSGAAAILSTMESVFSIDYVTGVVLMSPVRGNAMDDQPVRKLIIASAKEKSFPKAKKVFEESMAPKKFMKIDGKAHAQFLFFGPNGKKVTQAIVNFVLEK